MRFLSQKRKSLRDKKSGNLALSSMLLQRILRSYYGVILVVVKRQWNLQGNIDFTLGGDIFFLSKFSCKEDYEMVWNENLCLLNGRPFVKNMKMRISTN